MNTQTQITTISDKDRLDWLEANPFMAYRDTSSKHFTLVAEARKPRIGIVSDNLREAIDAAIERRVAVRERNFSIEEDLA